MSVRQIGLQVCFLTLLLSFTCWNMAYAQQTVSGTVTDGQSGVILPGVNILVKGTTTGTSTDNEGHYALAVPSLQDTLVFSFVGYKTRQVPINGRATINISLETQAISGEEMVVVGYGTQKKKNLTGAISTVNADQLQKQSLSNVSKALQGAAPGIQVTSSNSPGSGAKIRIHGFGTINNNSPLVIIDGVPSGLGNIDPSEIKDITVLKDAASTAIYGARGANGVILVTTINGEKDQAPQIKFNVRSGFARNTARYDMLNPSEFGEMLWLQSKNSGVKPTHPVYGSGSEPQIPEYILPAGANKVDLSQYDIKSFPITESNPSGTDWYDAVYNPGVVQEYNLAITGGSDNTTYGISASYNHEKGEVILTGNKRYRLRVNTSSDLTDWFEIGENIGLNQSNNWGYQSNGGINSTFDQVSKIPSIDPVYDVMGNYAPVSRLTGLAGQNNPVARAHRRQDVTRKNLGINGNAYAKVSISNNLSIKTLLGINYGDRHTKTPLETNPESYIARQYDQLSEGSSESRQWNWTNTLHYKISFADTHNIDILLGTEAIDNKFQQFGATRTKFFQTNKDYWVLNAGEGEMTNSGSASEWSQFSYFGRLQYNFKNKYLLNVTARRDGSSRFGRNNRYGTFPAVSIGWRISNENFMSSTNDWLNNLKIRASWGESGNNQIGNYNGFTTFSGSLRRSYYSISGSNNSLTSGIQSAAFGNPDAKWETTISKNIGIDATLFRSFGISMTVWQKNTHDMLYPKSIPFVRGQANIPSVNIGKMKNTGIDVGLSFERSTLNNDLNYNFTMNLSQYKNEVVKLSDNENEKIIGRTIRSQVYTRSKVGTSFPEYYGYKVLGIFQNEEEASNWPSAFGENGTYNIPGHFKYADINGDGIINDQDRTYIGNPHPDLIGSFNASAQYKQVDISIFLYASVGNDIVNIARRSLDFNLQQRNRSHRRLYESWGSPYLDNNKNAKMPIAELRDSGSQLPSTYYVEDGSYLRLKRVQIGYNVPKHILNDLSLQNLRIYVMASNLLTITGYSGLDPALNSSDRNLGEDLNQWPTPHRYMMGLNVGF